MRAFIEEGAHCQPGSLPKGFSAVRELTSANCVYPIDSIRHKWQMRTKLNPVVSVEPVRKESTRRFVVNTEIHCDHQTVALNRFVIIDTFSPPSSYPLDIVEQLGYYPAI